MKTSIIKKSEIFNNFDIRIDAEYFDPEYLQENFLIDNKGWLCFSDKNVKGGKRLPKGCKFSQEGIPYIRAEDIKDGFVEYENSPKISEELSERLKNYRTTYNDVLVTIVGNSIGDIGIVKYELEKCNLTENCAKIVNLAKILPEYVYVFLKSKYGQDQIKREKVGTAQPKLALTRIRKFKIPKLSDNFQNIIKELVNKSYIFIDKSKIKYKTAQTILNDELKIDELYFLKDKYFVKNSSESIVFASRLDAEFFHPKYDVIIEHLKSYSNGWDTIGNLFNQNKKSFVIDKNSIYKYVEIGSINTSNGEIAPEDIVGKELPANAKLKLNNGDILISKVRTYRGGVAIVDNTDYIGSGAFTVLQEKINCKINKEILYTFFKLKPILDLTLKYNTGTSYPTITDEDVLNMPIPIFKTDIQNKVKENIQETKALQLKSKQLFEIAKRGVEIAIEENEEDATNWINEQLSKMGVEI